MKKRLRKKLHLREFRALGFRVAGTYLNASKDADDALWWDAWLTFLESRNLVCGGSWSSPANTFAFMVERSPGSCDEADRRAVDEWLETRSDIATCELLPLEDLYYPKA